MHMRHEQGSLRAEMSRDVAFLICWDMRGSLLAGSKEIKCHNFEIILIVTLPELGEY